VQLQSTDINTRGFESLLDLVNNTANDSFDLYYGLFLYNQNATEELERLEQVGSCFLNPGKVTSPVHCTVSALPVLSMDENG